MIKVRMGRGKLIGILDMVEIYRLSRSNLEVVVGGGSVN
jgi:hypothetical protein